MDTEQAGVGLQAVEGAPPSEPASVTPEPQPSEPSPNYVSRDEVLRLLESVRAEARDYGQRGAQSFIDKTRLNERVGSTEKMLQQLVRDGAIDEQQASVYRHQARLEALTDLLPEPEPRPVSQPQTQQQPPAYAGVSPAIQKAYQRLAAKGLAPSDPEYVDPLRYDDPIDWMEALDKAVATKTARLAREQARQNAAAQTPPPAHTQPAPIGAAAIEVGGGVGGATATLEQLRQQLRAAYRRGDRGTIERLNTEIDRMLSAGGG